MALNSTRSLFCCGLWVFALTAWACADDNAWQLTACVPEDLPPESEYEIERVVDDFEGGSLAWSVIQGEQFAEAKIQPDSNVARAGESSMRVDYRFVGKTDFEYLQIRGKAEFRSAKQGIGFWMKHDGSPFSLRYRIVDIHGENHQLELQGTSEPGWQFVAGLLGSPTTAWGGDANGRIDFPCRLAGIVIDRPRRGFVGAGSLWIDDAAVVGPRRRPAPSLQIEVRDRRFGNLYAVGEFVQLRAKGKGERIRWETRDFFGHVIHAGNGSGKGALIQFELAEPGWYSCHAELIQAGTVVEAVTFPCAALADRREAARSEFVGVCSHFGQNKYPLDSMDLMLRYGIDQYRDEIGWRSYEPVKGEYQMPEHAAAFLERSAELGMRPLLIFDYSNPYYDEGGFPNSPEAIEAFSKYAVHLASKTQGVVPFFEVWNEWIGGCGMKDRPGLHTAEAYGRLLKPTYEAVKRAFPDREVIGIGGEYGVHCADNVATAIATAGPDAMDAWSIHPYRYPISPEASDLADEVTDIARRVAAAGAKSKAWITEIGYPTHTTSRGCDPFTQARHCVRTLTLLQATGLVEKVFWYDLKDDGLRRDYNEHNFGLIHHQQFNCAPKPGIVAMSVFIRMTAGCQFQRLQRLGDGYAAWYGRSDGSQLAIGWTTVKPESLSALGEFNSAVDIMGRSIDLDSATSLTESPMYLLRSP